MQTPRATFPLYYWQSGDVFLFGTSPSLFKAHRTFSPKVSECALVSILMLNFTAGGQSIFKSVRRNTPGHLVQYSPGNPVREIEANRLHFSDGRFGKPYSTVRDEVRNIMDEFLTPLSAEPNLDLLLSGGQDTRMLAGLIAKHTRREAIRCVSIGNQQDQELNCSCYQARTLPSPSRTASSIQQKPRPLRGSCCGTAWSRSPHDSHRRTARKVEQCAGRPRLPADA